MIKKLLCLMLLFPLAGMAQSKIQNAEIRAKMHDQLANPQVAAPTMAKNISLEPCAAVDVPYLEDFESAAAPEMPACTTLENAGAGNNFNTITAPGFGFTTITMQYKYHSTNPANAWFFTAGLNLTAGVSYSISYKYGSRGSNAFIEKFKVYIGNEAASVSMSATPLADHPDVRNNVTAITNTIAFTPETTGVYYVGFNCYSATDQWLLFIDDIAVSATLATNNFDRTDLKYYPNPVNETLNLSYNEQIDSVTIYNLTGQTVLQQNVKSENALIHTDDLAKGTYFAKIMIGDSEKTVKFLKN
ncbi:T9SS type A sorting domain-containing protein [Flavobacterium noncentrifugens]|uniref:Por secretion system C-terminal sorting domain-containing protein n=1 Tax=Flavobacterium noncentrifugens TaxID=1128970 RepID=A0A1G9AJA2_9FLAO|nr:T9SS type A sorting domain-containing protein [Flavobacterium noncentrifugens]SDK26605.1 Por secretion system C-terminal sorting domain-containing protein [Flavobacterium noncentrifugens]